MKYIKEAIRLSFNQLKIIFSIFLAIWGILSGIFRTELLFQVLYICLLLIILISCINVGHWYIKIKRGFLSLKLMHERQVTLMRNSFEINADYLFKHMSQEELRTFVMIMGIDRTGKMKLNTTQGVAYYMLKYLDEHYSCNNTLPSVEIQTQIDIYCDKKTCTDSEYRLAYTDCIEIKMNLVPQKAMGKEIIPCNLIMVANSRKTEIDSIECLEGDGTTNIIIPAIFEYLKKKDSYKSAMIGIIGSNKMSQPYNVIFSQIINQFMRISILDRSFSLKHLHISIREEDYHRWQLSLSQIEAYVYACSRFYREFH